MSANLHLILTSADPYVIHVQSAITDYFNANVAYLVIAFISVAGVLWILNLLFETLGIGNVANIDDIKRPQGWGTPDYTDDELDEGIEYERNDYR